MFTLALEPSCDAQSKQARMVECRMVETEQGRREKRIAQVGTKVPKKKKIRLGMVRNGSECLKIGRRD